MALHSRQDVSRGAADWVTGGTLPVLLAAVTAMLLLPAWALSRRLPRERLLDAPLRKRIHDLVGERPGRSIQEIARTLDVHFTTAEHHVRILREYGLLAVDEVRGRSACFHAGAAINRKERVLASVAASPVAGRVLRAVSTTPGCTTTEIARALGLPLSTTDWHLHRLEREGLATPSRGPGRRVRWSVPALSTRGPGTPSAADVSMA